MAAQDLDLMVLDLYLFRDDDDEEDLTCKRMLQALVHCEVTPPQTAADFDSWVVQDANRRLAKLLQRADPRSLTAEEDQQGLTLRAISPNASGKIELVFPMIAKLCSAFPPRSIPVKTRSSNSLRH